MLKASSANLARRIGIVLSRRGQDFYAPLPRRAEQATRAELPGVVDIDLRETEKLRNTKIKPQRFGNKEMHKFTCHACKVNICDSESFSL